MSFRNRYLLYMASLSPVQIVLALAVMAATDQFEGFSVVLLANLFWLIGVNLIGANLIFRPIDRFVRAAAAASAPEKHALTVKKRVLGAGLGD